MRKLAIALAIATATTPNATAHAQLLDIERFTEEGEGSVNTWILEGENEVVIIDTQRSLSAGTAAAQRAKAVGKPIAAILITHAHPDHFGGLASLLEVFPDTPVYASSATVQIMDTDANGFIAATKQALGENAPDVQPLPTRTFANGEVLTFGSIRLRVDEIGQGEADAMTMFYSPDENVLFTGDLVDNEMTPFLMEGQTSQWLEQLAGVKSDYETLNPLVFPGHGKQATMALLDGQAGMIAWLRKLVALKANDGLTDKEIANLVFAYERRYPDHPPVAAIPTLVEENVKAIAQEMEQEY